MGASHGIAGEPGLKQMAAPALSEIDMAGIASVRFGQCPAQPIPRLRQQDQVNMIVHQAPAQAGNGRRFTGLGEQLKIERPIRIGEEQRQAPIATLGDVVWNTG